MQMEIKQMFEDKKIYKKYMAVIWGNPSWNETSVEGYIYTKPN